ncbi:MAG: hypothetical protein VYE67_13625, partial [Planctomycetota bacterium]|nr:hypothetical protein [Planctomycetota bacterium]
MDRSVDQEDASNPWLGETRKSHLAAAANVFHLVNLPLIPPGLGHGPLICAASWQDSILNRPRWQNFQEREWRPHSQEARSVSRSVNH